MVVPVALAAASIQRAVGWAAAFGRTVLCIAISGDCEKNVKVLGRVARSLCPIALFNHAFSHTVQLHHSIALEINMTHVARWGICVSALLLFVHDTPARAMEGQLFIIGGGLRPDNSELFRRLLAAEGGAKNCRIAIFRTASFSTASAELFRGVFRRYEVPAECICLPDIRLDNAAISARDPKSVEQVDNCNIAFFVGGDQQRITQSLLNSDGSDTPVLVALRKLLKRGGVVAGTSAGAAMQSRVMIGAGGLPDDSLDEGMDTLDFGVSKTLQRRGLAVSRGLGFFTDGIADSHFSQFRGRLGRLARALVAEKVDYGFGIDENTALVVAPGGVLEVVGMGCVTIVNVKMATCSDGPLGCTLTGVSVSCLQAGDRWDSAKGQVCVPAEKKPLSLKDHPNRGNFLVPDIAGEGAVRHALFRGLAENTSDRQQGIALRYSESFAHGYRYTFRKTERSKCWGGPVADWYSVSVQDIDVKIEPIVSSLQPPLSLLPIDLPSGKVGTACQALWFRGVLAANAERRLRPEARLTRAELAFALAQSIYLLPPLGELPPIADVATEAPCQDEIRMVLEAKLLNLNHGCFRPDDAISRQDAAEVLVDLYRRNGGAMKPIAGVFVLDDADISDPRRKAVQTSLQLGLLRLSNGRFRPRDQLTRGEAAAAIYRCLDLPW
jgi:cyanophycinase